MPQVFNEDLLAQDEALKIYRISAQKCGDIDWRDAHPLAFITSLIYDATMPPRIRLDAARECLKYILAPQTPRQGLIIDSVPLQQRFPMLEILLNAPEERAN